MTGLDFPGLLSAVVFTQGCNFHCPYCHNARLIPRPGAAGIPPHVGEADQVSRLIPRPQAAGISPEAALAFLKKRAGLLDGVVISGGEPTLQPGLNGFCRSAKNLGYKVKLDTNGSRPEALRELLREGLLDYVAVDCKTLPGHYYPALCAERDAADALRRTLELLHASGVAHEARTTCVHPFVSPERMPGLASFLGNTPWFLQKANVTAAMRETGLEAVAPSGLACLAGRAVAAGARAAVR